MPLLHKKKFVRKKPPKDLKPTEEVFFCSATHEIFRNYEEFFERTILVNSLVWSCEVCGKGELTYEEAQECETRAQKALMVFSGGLMRGILSLIDLTYRSSFNLLVDDVFQFIKERYFVDEPVEFTPQGQKKARSGCVVRVNHPSDSRTLNGECQGQSTPKFVNGRLSDVNTSTIDLTESDDEIQIVQEENSPSQAMPVAGKNGNMTPQTTGGSAKNSPKFKELDVPQPSSLLYLIRDDEVVKTFCVSASKVMRQRGVLSKDRIRNFLRIVTEVKPNIGYYRVNSSEARRKFGITNFSSITWEHVFGGSIPKFNKNPLSNIQQSRLAAAAASTASHKQLSKEKGKYKKVKSDKDGLNKKGRKSHSNKTDEKKKKKKKPKGKDGLLNSPSDGKTLQQIASEAEAAKRKEKVEEMQREWRRLEEEMKRRETEKQARLAERERHKEEKRLRELLVKEWSKPRDDLACDDLRVLPEPTLVESKIPSKCFGDALSVIEFFSTFLEVFGLRGDLRGFSSSSTRGPPGSLISFHTLEKALLSKDPNGPLADLFFSLLTALHKLQQREDRDELVIDDEEDAPSENVEGGPSKVYSHRLHDAVRAASHCARITVNRLGETLSQVHLDSMTLTEVLRLHLLSSGARVSRRVALSRWRCRGGMTNLDDPGLHFARTEPGGIELVNHLERSNVFDLSVRDKLWLLRVLMDQLLTYANARQAIDGSCERVKSLRAELRSLSLSLMRAERNLATLKIRRKQAKKFQIEQAMATAAMGSVSGDNDEKEKENKKDNLVKMHTSPVTKKPMTRKGKKESSEHLTKNPASLDLKEITDELIQEAEEALEEMKSSVAEKENEIMENLIHALAGFSGPVSLGRDRAYRRYWLSRGLSGLLVESPGIDSDEERKALLLEARVCRQMKSEDDRFSLQRHSRTSDSGMKFITSWDNAEQISAGDPVHHQWLKLVQESCSGNEHWYFYPDMISVDDLSGSLNQRGFREASLKASLTEYRSVLEEAIDYCPVEDLVKAATEAAKAEMKAVQRETIDQQENDESNNHFEHGEENDAVGDIDQKSKVVTFGVKSRGNLVHGRAGSDSASEWMELNLREALLDLEERIYAGALGSIKVKDRERWRDILEKGGYESLVSEPLEENGEENVTEPFDKDEKLDIEMDEDSNATIAAKQDEISERVVRDLSSALVQIANGIQTRFIVAPLGDHDEATKEAQRKAKIQAKIRKQQERERRERIKATRHRSRNKQNVEEDIYISSSSSEEEAEEDSGLSTFERWQQGLQQATSLSQIALYLSALDRSISWSKSLLKARCKLCRRKGDDSQLLLCDGCDRGFHMYCLKPRLTKVPTGDWFCPGCRPQEPEPEPPRRNRKKVTCPREEESEEEEDEDTDTDGGDGESDESTEGEEDSDDESAASSSAEQNEESVQDDEKDAETTDEEEEDEDSDDDDDDEEEDSQDENESGGHNKANGRRSGRIREAEEARTAKARTAKVRLPLATPNRSSRSQQRNPIAVSRLASRSRSNPAENSQLTASGGSRGRLKRGHPDSEALRDVELLVNEIARQENAWPFMNPVKKSEVPDYYDIIKYPMDIGSMRVNFNRLVYDSPQQPMIDLCRIFANCELYNQDSSEEYQCSVDLRRFAEKRVRELGLSKYFDKAMGVVGGHASNSATLPSKKRTRIS